MTKNKNHIDKLFDKARNQKPESSFDEISGQFLNDLKAGKTSSLNTTVAKSFNFKYLIMLSTISVVIISTVIYFNPNSSVKEKNVNNPIENKPITKPRDTSFKEQEVFVVESISIDEKIIQTTTTVVNEQNDSIIVNTESEKDTVVPVIIPESKPVFKRKTNNVYRFPKLTEQEVEENNKQKKLMLKKLNKLDKKKYAYIPSGTYNHNGESISVHAFHMQTTEVTVLEYRTFLFDLLIQDRKEDFMRAKPDQTKWREINGHKSVYNEPMVEHYFSHPAYNAYPVNNVSREGAEMYCKWLTEEASKVRNSKLPMLNDVRIPSDYEWMLAAKGGADDDAFFPWETSSVRNKKGCYLANYKPITDSIFNRETGAYESCSGCNHWIADGAFYTAKVDSYLPNGYGLYCMSGNLAEMVIYWKDKTPGTKGGSWTSDLEELEIEGKDRFIGVTDAEVNIGFRVVISFMGK